MAKTFSPIRPFAIAKLCLGFGLLASFGCVSSGKYEDLQRRYKLATIETSNKQHERDQLASELKAARAEAERLAARLSDAQDQLDATEQDASKVREDSSHVREDLDATRTKLRQTLALVAEIRSQLASNALSSKQARQRLLGTIDAANGDGVAPSILAVPGQAVSH